MNSLDKTEKLHKVFKAKFDKIRYVSGFDYSFRNLTRSNLKKFDDLGVMDEETWTEKPSTN